MWCGHPSMPEVDGVSFWADVDTRTTTVQISASISGRTLKHARLTCAADLRHWMLYVVCVAWMYAYVARYNAVSLQAAAAESVLQRQQQ